MLKAIVNDVVIADKIMTADTFLTRLTGLLGRKRLDAGEGLLITNCKQIHMIGMKFSIDAIFLSKDGQVLHIEHSIRPGRISKYVRNADKVLEIKAGTAKDFNIDTKDYIIFKKQEV